MKDSDRRPTLADVARRAGLSKSAASLILNDRPGSRLSAEAAERVRTAAAELGYRPNPHAQSLRLGKTRTIGFISDQVTITRYASGMIKGILSGARAHDHTVLIAETGQNGGSFGAAIESMVDRRVDGIVVGLMAARLVDVPAPPVEIPLVLVNGASPQDLPNVLPDERTAGHAIAKVLIDAGHTEIGVIGELPSAADPRNSIMIGLRFERIKAAFAESGLVPTMTTVDEWSPRVGYEQTHEILRRNPRITGLIAGNDNMAFGIYQALNELGLRIPDDISVVSFDDDELASYLRPGLTTARLPYEEMAFTGVEMLLGDRDPVHETVPMPITRRGSVRTL